MKVVFFTIVKLLLIIGIGFYFHKRKILKEESLNFLNFFVVNLTMPFLIFSQIIKSFIPSSQPSFGVFIILSFLIFLVGLILGGSSSVFIPQNVRREFISLVSFQNCGYLPMNIAMFLFSSPLRERFLVYIFLYVLGFNILIWSVGSFFIFKKKKEDFKISSLFTPPIISVILAVICVYCNGKRFIPEVVLSPMRMLGNTSFPLSMIILGAWLSKSRLRCVYEEIFPILGVIVLKLIVMPLLAFMFVWKYKVYSLLGLFILLEFSMPSAVSLPIVVNLRKANSEFTSRGVFFTHFFSIFTLPLWLHLFLKISGFSF